MINTSATSCEDAGGWPRAPGISWLGTRRAPKSTLKAFLLKMSNTFSKSVLFDMFYVALCQLYVHVNSCFRAVLVARSSGIACTKATSARLKEAYADSSLRNLRLQFH